MCDAAGVCIDAAIRKLSICVPQGVVIALLDTCRVSPKTSGGGLTRGPAAVTEDNPKINVQNFDGDVLVGYACARAAEAQDGGKDGHGLYTRQVLEVRIDMA